MLKFFVLVLLFIAGVTAGLGDEDICEEGILKACPDDDMPSAFPETEEEFKNLCNSAIENFQCQINYLEKCAENEKAKEIITKYLSSMEEICNEDNLIYAAIVDHLQCYADIKEDGEMEKCAEEAQSESIESLAETGLVALLDGEVEPEGGYSCVPDMLALACLGRKIEYLCGTVALDTLVEIAQKFDSEHEVVCANNIHLLPEVIRILKLKEEEANEISDILEKMK